MNAISANVTFCSNYQMKSFLFAFHLNQYHFFLCSFVVQRSKSEKIVAINSVDGCRFRLIGLRLRCSIIYCGQIGPCRASAIDR